MAFAHPRRARLPLDHPKVECLTTLARASLRAADWPVGSPRFEPGLSTEHGGFPTGDPGVSPDRTLTGWLP